MTILSAQPPPTDTAAVEITLKPTEGSAVPGPLRFLGRGIRTLWSNKKARVGMLLLGFFVLVAVFAPLIAPHSPTATTFTPYQGPSSENWFGTTGNGEDVFSQLVYGARVSLLVGLCAGIVATLIAVTLRPGLGLPAGDPRRDHQLRHEPRAGHPRAAADDHPGGVPLRAARSGRSSWSSRSPAGPPGRGSSAARRSRCVPATSSPRRCSPVSGCSESCSGRSCPT